MKKIFLVVSFAFLFFLTPFEIKASDVETYGVTISPDEFLPSNIPTKSGCKYYLKGSTYYFCSAGEIKVYSAYSEGLDITTNKGITWRSSSEIYRYEGGWGKFVDANSGISGVITSSNFNVYHENGKLLLGKEPGAVEEAIATVQMEKAMEIVLEVLPIVVLSIVSYLGLRKAFHWLLLQLKGC